jgi:hypothetical protein
MGGKLCSTFWRDAQESLKFDNLLVELKKYLLDPKSFMLINETAKRSAKLVKDVVIRNGWDEDEPNHYTILNE